MLTAADDTIRREGVRGPKVGSGYKISSRNTISITNNLPIALLGIGMKETGVLCDRIRYASLG